MNELGNLVKKLSLKSRNDNSFNSEIVSGNPVNFLPLRFKNSKFFSIDIDFDI